MRFASRREEPDEGLAAARRLQRLAADPFGPRGLTLAARFRAQRLAVLRARRSRWGAFVGWNAPDRERAEFAAIDGALHELSAFDKAEAGVLLELLARLGRQRSARAE